LRKIIFLSIFFMIVLSNVLFACECYERGSVESEFFKHDTVFIGKVIKIEQSINTLEVKFELIKSYKGVPDKSIVVSTSVSGKACGFPFKENEKYLIWASNYEGKLSTSICSGTKGLTEATEDLKGLDKITNKERFGFSK